MKVKTWQNKWKSKNMVEYKTPQTGVPVSQETLT
jgi:hypothetical protein